MSHHTPSLACPCHDRPVLPPSPRTFWSGCSDGRRKPRGCPVALPSGAICPPLSLVTDLCVDVPRGALPPGFQSTAWTRTDGGQSGRVGVAGDPGRAGREGPGPPVGPGREPRGPRPPEAHLRDSALVLEAVTGGGGRPDRLLPRQAMNTLHELPFAREFETAVREAHPELLLALLTQLHYVLELNLQRSPRPARRPRRWPHPARGGEDRRRLPRPAQGPRQVRASWG